MFGCQICCGSPFECCFLRLFFIWNLSFLARRILFGKSEDLEIFGKKTQLSKKNDLNLNGLFSLGHFFLQTSMFLRRIICGRFGEETTFCRSNFFSFWKASSARFDGWKVSRCSRLSCLSSLPVSSKWASFEFALIDFFVFSCSLQSGNAFIVCEQKQLKVFWDLG